MGRLIDGTWHDNPPPRTGDGRFHRPDSSFRHWVTPDGAPGPSGEGGFAAAPGRYHLFVAINCPWAHRTLLVRNAKGLHDAISLSVAMPRRAAQGWQYDPTPGSPYAEPELGVRYLHQVYTMADPHYTGTVTVPVLWDRQRHTVVSNESSEIIVMLNGAFAGLVPDAPDLYPADLQPDIDALNERVYKTVNNGVYRAGFARTQGAYDEAVGPLFDTLDMLDVRLADRRFLFGDHITLADWRLFPTLVRFDVAYHGAFKCNRRRIRDYANLSAYTRDLYQQPGVAATVDLDIYKRGYYSPSPARNPFGIVPAGPRIDLSAPHGRAA